jgi:translocation and assembly module TamB
MKLTIAILLAIALAAGAALAWLAGTTGGVRWLLAEVSGHSGLRITARKVEGRLYDHLHLEGVRITARGSESEFAVLDLSWQPLLLLAGKVAVSDLTMNGVSIRNNTPPSASPPDLTWPTLTGIPAWFDGSIGRLRVDKFTYQRGEEPRVTVSAFSTAVTWQDMLLSLRNLSGESQTGRLTGLAEAGFRTPSLRLDLVASPTWPVAKMDRLALRVNLHPGRHHEQLAGNIALNGGSGSRQLLEITGEAGLTRSSINLKHVRLVNPGRKGMVSAEGAILLSAGAPRAKLQLTADGLDLKPELGMATDISGEAAFEGGKEGYRGKFTLANRGKEWRSTRLSGEYRGDTEGVSIDIREGKLLDGSVLGRVAIAWKDGFSLAGTLSGSHLNPARIAPDWEGTVNLDLQGTVAKRGTAPLEGNVAATFRDSVLHGKALHGDLQADFAGGNLRIGSLALQGNGFDIHASGELGNRLDVSARVSDLTRLIPGMAGQARAEGWVRWHKKLTGGYLSATGRDLATAGVKIGTANVAARLDEGPERQITARATLGKLLYRRFRADSATLAFAGTLAHHTIAADLQTAGAQLRLGLAGAWHEGNWQGEIVQLSGRDQSGPWHMGAPAHFALAAGSISFSPLVITGITPERLEISGDISRPPLHGSLQVRWSGLNLARANYWLSGMQVTGASSGSLFCRLSGEERLAVTGAASLQGTVTVDNHRLTIRQSSLSIDWGEKGLKGAVEVHLADGGMLKGSLVSPATAGLALPSEGNVALDWSGFDLLFLRPWLPEGVTLTGAITGKVTGKVLSGNRLDLRGTTRVSGGKVSWRRAGGELSAALRTAEMSWTWQGDSLRGAVELALEDYGKAEGSFQIPVPALLPLALDRKGPLRATLNGTFREMGLITSLFPGMVQESHGDVAVNLQAVGSWETPRFSGSLELTKAGAYLPAAGIQLKEVKIAARLEQGLIRIESFRATSGTGSIGGTAVIRLDGWRVADYQGTINGERFQAVYLPELQVTAAPQLTFEGTPKRLTVRGDLKLPELLVYGSKRRPTVAPSKDVIIEDVPLPSSSASPLELDVKVRILLGDRVLVKAEGIDAQLGGSIELAFSRMDKITSTGKINVVKGRYKTYGIDLQIVRGLLYYAGGPINRPLLDILALRTVGEVRAGVTVGGTPQSPVVKLYSEPAMPDIDILAYVVLGHPLGSSTEQAGLMGQAAGLLLSAGDSVVLQDQIKKRLGLSTLGIESTGTTTGHMGYTPVAVTPPGTSPATAAASSLSQSMVAVGKYLTPQLYVSYGRSLFTGSNLLRLRYNIFKGLGIESEMGTESGADLYYKIDLK